MHTRWRWLAGMLMALMLVGAACGDDDDDRGVGHDDPGFLADVGGPGHHDDHGRSHHHHGGDA